MSVVVGPWGGNGGTAWDDGIYNGVREITLVYDRCIDSISVVYDKNGKPIQLKFPEEFLISVTGYYCPVVYG
ncbi:hypothetical protein Gotri_003602, partial [Gossypium trilobum]|nr:hypothetical protein [Gossypium trilobum]